MKKKDVLFYTFLSLFIVTALITLLGIVDLIQIRDGYLNTLVGVFVLELAGAVIALFKKVDFFTDEETGDSDKRKQDTAPDKFNDMIIDHTQDDGTSIEKTNEESSRSESDTSHFLSANSPIDFKRYNATPSPSDIIEELNKTPPAQRAAKSKFYHGLKVRWNLRFHTTTTTDIDKSLEESATVKLMCKAGLTYPWIYMTVRISDYPFVKLLTEDAPLIVYGEVYEAEGHDISLREVLIENDSK